jgi:hypothetical protein
LYVHREKRATLGRPARRSTQLFRAGNPYSVLENAGAVVNPGWVDVTAAVLLNRRVLLLDACSARAQVGWLEGDAAAWRWAAADGPSDVALFQALEKLEKDPASAGAFAFADSPGSILGNRIAAMAIRTWCEMKPRPVYAYNALELLAQGAGRSNLTWIADARRDRWHVLRVPTALDIANDGSLVGRDASPRRPPPSQNEPEGSPNSKADASERRPYLMAELGGGPFATAAEFRHWTPLPPGTDLVPYNLATLWPAAAHADLLRPTDAPDAWLPAQPEYATWGAKIHGA